LIDLRYDVGGRCSSCNRRQAVYLRRSSGERLCTTCFERSIIKSVKRSLREVKELKPGTLILVITTLDKLVEGLTLSYVLNKIERAYGCRVLNALSIALDDVHIVTQLSKVHEVSDGIQHIIIPLRSSIPSINSSFRDYLKLCLKIAVAVSINIVALPLTLNDVSEVVVNSLFDGDLKSAGLMHSFKVDGVTAVIPFYKLTTSEVYAYSYLRNIYNLDIDLLMPPTPICHRASRKVLRELINDLSMNNPELTQTLSKFIELLKSI